MTEQPQSPLELRVRVARDGDGFPTLAMTVGELAKVYAGSKDLPKRSPIGAGQFFTAKQLAAGPVPPDPSPIWWIDWSNMPARNEGHRIRRDRVFTPREAGTAV